jgi:hypothetical protein
MFWQKQTTVKINISKPCSENWDAMDAAGCNRYCPACQKVIIDFSVLNDEAILQHIEQAKGKEICGRFANHQLNRVLQPAPNAEPVNYLKKVAASVMLICTALNKAWAQMPVVQHPVYVAQDKGSKVAAKDSSVIITGRVTDFTGLGVQGLTLNIKGTDSIATTNKYGRFKFVLAGGGCVGMHIRLVVTNADNIATAKDTLIEVTALPFKKDLLLKAYPVGLLKPVDCVANYKPPVYIEHYEERKPIYTDMTTTGITDVETVKPTPRQKILHFFRPKKYPRLYQ